MSSSQLTPIEIKEEKVVKVVVKEDVPLVKYKKRKVDDAGLSRDKAEG